MSNTINQTVINIDTMNGNIIGAGVVTSTADFYRELFVYLESKRVLYYGCENENKKHCTESVLDVKRDLKDRIQQRGLSGNELKPINAMLDACNAYLDSIDRVQNTGGTCKLKVALNALRDGFRVAVGDVEAVYGLQFKHSIHPPCK